MTMSPKIANKHRRALALTVAVTVAAVVAAGCRFHMPHMQAKAAPPVVAKPAQPVVYQPLAVDLTKVQPNETGTIPIIMFHDIITTPKPKGLKYPAAMFRKDIEWLYAHNYRPISLTEFAQGKIDCPAGMSPVILTFDDALRSQFNFTADGKVDPDCAVGILDAFHAAHPDWLTRGTFFVLTDKDPKLPPPFYQKPYAAGKMEYLVKEGYDIGNHTVHHPRMNSLPDQRAEAEIAGALVGIKAYLPDYNVNTLALPYGLYPKNKKLVESGESGGVSYHNVCAMRAAWRPVPAPMNVGFNRYELERITAGEKFHESRWWCQYLETNKAEKYVSDGDPKTYTVNAIAKGQLNMARLKALGFHLRTYTGTQFTTQ